MRRLKAGSTLAIRASGFSTWSGILGWVGFDPGDDSGWQRAWDERQPRQQQRHVTDGLPAGVVGGGIHERQAERAEEDGQRVVGDAVGAVAHLALALVEPGIHRVSGVARRADQLDE